VARLDFILVDVGFMGSRDSNALGGIEVTDEDAPSLSLLLVFFVFCSSSQLPNRQCRKLSVMTQEIC
jgi:hypothetical protein